jgi:hypothetical protein
MEDYFVRMVESTLLKKPWIDSLHEHLAGLLGLSGLRTQLLLPDGTYVILFTRCLAFLSMAREQWHTSLRLPSFSHIQILKCVICQIGNPIYDTLSTLTSS